MEEEEYIEFEIEDSQPLTLDLLLQKLGLTIKAFSDAVGVSEATVYRWKSRSGPINSDDIYECCQVLGVSSDELLESLGYDMSIISRGASSKVVKRKFRTRKLEKRT